MTTGFVIVSSSTGLITFLAVGDMEGLQELAFGGPQGVGRRGAGVWVLTDQVI